MRLAHVLLPLALAAALPAFAQGEGKAEDVVMLPDGYEAAMKQGDLLMATFIIRPAADQCEAGNKAKGACFLLFLSAAYTDLELMVQAGDARNSMAGRSITRAYDYLLPIVREDPEMFGMISSLKGKLRLFERRHAEAEALFRDAYGANIAIVPRDEKAIIGALGNMAVALASQGRDEEAVPLYREALVLARANGDPDYIQSSLISLGTSLDRTGSGGKAESIFRDVLRTAEQGVSPYDPLLARHLANLASTLESASRYVEAEPLRRRVLAMRIASNDYAPMRNAHSALATNLYDQRRYAEAEPLAIRAFEMAGGLDLGDPNRTVTTEQLGKTWSYLASHHPGARTLLADAMRGRIVEAQDRPGFDSESQLTMARVKPIAARLIAVAWALAHR